MDGSIGMGCMAVFAVSGSVAFLAIHAHNRLLSDYMDKIEFELGSKEWQHKKIKKKKVRFAQNVEDLSQNCEKEHSCKKKLQKSCLKRDRKSSMPQNRVALYRGIIQYKMLYPKNEYGVSWAQHW